MTPDATDTNPFRYCGEYYDKETGTYYLRARYYDPRIGRFTSRDTYKGEVGDPLSLNLYAYCVDNPVIYSDPSGHIGVKADGTIYMSDSDTEIDRQLLLLKIEYDKAGADKKAIAAQAAKLRADNPNAPGKNDKWHVTADKSLEYYIIVDVTDKLNNTMKAAERKYSGYRFAPDVVRYGVFYFLVKNGSTYDLKNQSDWQHEHFYYDGEIIDKDAPGNICYGYLGKSFGFRDTTLRAFAGYAQMRAGTSTKEWQNFSTFGDDPRDTARINQGIQIYKNSHSWIWW